VPPPPGEDDKWSWGERGLRTSWTKCLVAIFNYAQAEENWGEKKMWPKEVGEIQDGGQRTNDKNKKKKKGPYLESF